jgi:phytoene dehydrogenase-like protein
VVLADGSELAADCVVSGADPKTTFARLLGYPELDAGFARRIENFRSRGAAAKLHLALDGLPAFSGLDAAATGQRLLLAGTMDEIETAFNASKYGEHSAHPVMEVVIPSVHDDSVAPAGKHLLSAVVQYAPTQPIAGLDACRESLLAAALERLETAAPGIRDQVTAAELVLPADLEAEFGATGGHWHHGEMAMDQVLFTRPVPGAHRYATPVPGLYLCGAGSHPGGGVMGLAGRNAAGVVFDTEGATP